MREIFHIMDYSNTVEKQINLYKLIKKIKEKYPVVVSSHFPLPDWLTKECDFYFFDQKNLLIYDYNIKNNKFYSTDNFHIEYKPYDTVSAHIVAITRLVLLVNSAMKSMGYDIIHQIEYDCEILNFEEFEKNSELSKTNDVVCYLETVYQNKIENPIWYHGVYQTLNLNSFDYTEFIYDEEKIIKTLYESFYGGGFFQEKMTNMLFYENKKVHVKHLEEVKKSIKYNFFTIGHSVWEIENSYSFFIKDGKYSLFVDNSTFEVYEFKIIYDGIEVENYTVFPKTWFLTSTNKSPKSKVEIIINEKYSKKFNLKNEYDVGLLYATSFNLKG